MKSTWTVLGTAGVVAVVCLLLADGATQAQAPGGRLKYGVVDLGEVMRNLNEVQEMRTRLETRASEFRKEGEARQKKIEDVRFARDQEHPDSPKWFDLQKELNRLTVELELWTKFEKRDIELETREQQSRLYKRVLVAVQEVSTQMGLDMALQMDGIDLNDPNEVVTSQRMTLRSVIYAAPTIDLTKAVIARVNHTTGKK
jgi:Skp family chaperone for outer membrane proteins